MTENGKTGSAKKRCPTCVFIRIAITFLFATCSWAQLTIDLHQVSGLPSDGLKEAQRRVQKVRDVSWRPPQKEEELAVMKEVGRIARAYFQPWSEPPQIGTFTEKGNDILVARWVAPGGGGAISELIVWDTPQDTTFLFGLPAGSWSSDSSVRSTFERLLLPTRPDARTPPAQGVTLNMARNAETHQRIGTGVLVVKFVLRQFDIPLNWADLWETPTADYVSIGFNKSAISGFPANMRSIPERFPPLEERIAQWSKQRILDELATPVTGERDRVLTLALLNRDVSEDELLAVLKSRWRSENGALLQTMVKERQVARFSGSIREYLREFGRIRRLESPFQIISRTDDVNFTDVALDVLREVVGAQEAFRYAAAHGATPADYRILKDLQPLDVTWMAERDIALQLMRKRIRLDDDGNPLPK